MIDSSFDTLIRNNARKLWIPWQADTVYNRWKDVDPQGKAFHRGDVISTISNHGDSVIEQCVLQDLSIRLVD
jgi:hypothetical protein